MSKSPESISEQGKRGERLQYRRMEISSNEEVTELTYFNVFLFMQPVANKKLYSNMIEKSKYNNGLWFTVEGF